MQDVGIWSVVPPIVAIVLAVLTKEVIFSLVCGILSGTVIYVLCNQLSLIQCFSTTVDIMIAKLGENIAMIVFVPAGRTGCGHYQSRWSSCMPLGRAAVLKAGAVRSLPPQDFPPVYFWMTILTASPAEPSCGR